MMVGLGTRKKEMGDEDKNDMENTSRYKRSRVQLGCLSLKDLVLVLLSARLGLVMQCRGWYIDSCMKCSEVPVSHDGLLHPL